MNAVDNDGHTALDAISTDFEGKPLLLTETKPPKSYGHFFIQYITIVPMDLIPLTILLMFILI